MAADEIERFRRAIIERKQDSHAADNLTDSDLLREVMNTVGKEGQLGGQIRCVVSVAMLTEGWDANNVTHVLGVRAFGTQLLCEQVLGRALRRLSYEINEDGEDAGKFSVEYADVFGIPFDFTAQSVNAPVQKPRETIQVKAMRPERDALEIRFPRVAGYRVDLPSERLEATFDDNSHMEITPEIVGAAETQNSGIIGLPANLNLAHTAAEKITAAITRHFKNERPISALLDPYNPSGSTRFVRFNTSKTERWETHSERSHINWVVLDSDWEAEFCDVYAIEADFAAKVASHFNRMIQEATAAAK